MRVVIACLLLGVATGCGGNSAPPSVPPPVVAPAPAPQQLAPNPSPVKQAARQADKPAKQLPEQEFTSRDWELNNSHPNFEVATEAESQAAQQFYSLAPVSGEDSRMVDAFPPGEEKLKQSAEAKSLPTGFTALTHELSESGWPLKIRCEGDGSEMVLIPSLIAQVGRNGGPEDAAPEHPAFVSAFYMDRTEVRLIQYLNYRDRIKSEQTKLLPAPSNEQGDISAPALGISWRDADAYARFYKKELPTEAEWETAGRGEQGFFYPWGNGRELWDGVRNPGQIDQVGRFQTDQSQFGVMDLAGNAREWCSDWYRPDGFKEALEADGSPKHNWTGPSRANPVGHRVVKGSSTGWELYARGHGTMAQGQPDVGFRCVLRLSE